MKINSFFCLPQLNQLVSKQRQGEWVQASLSNPDQPTPEPTHPFLTRLYALFNANLSDSGFGLEQMMSELGMSRTNLFRKVKALTGLTAHEMLRNYRLKQAVQLLRSGVSVGETAYRVGFESPAYFSKCFRDLYRVSPREFMAQSGLSSLPTYRFGVLASVGPFLTGFGSFLIVARGAYALLLAWS